MSTTNTTRPRARVRSRPAAARRWLGLAAAVLAAALLPAAAASAQPTTTGAALPGNGTSYGVAIEGTTALVGETTATGSRLVAVFTLGSSGWKQTATLTPPSTSTGGSFGNGVALDGSTTLTAVVGAGNEVDVYIQNKGGQWALQKEIPKPADDVGGANFGAYPGGVTVSGNNTLGVGDNNESSSGFGSGAAWVYTRTKNTWTETKKLTEPTPAGGDGFGNSVSLSGSQLVVGSPDSNSTAGAAYVFGGTGWSHEATLNDPTGSVGVFGFSVALNGGTAVIGEPAGRSPDCSSGVIGIVGGPSRCDAGEAWVFQEGNSPSSWQAQTSLNSTAFPDPSSNFGDQVATDGSRIVATSPNNSDTAYVFTSPGAGLWNAAEELKPVTPNPSLIGFGEAVGVSGSTEVVGSFSENAGVYP